MSRLLFAEIFGRIKLMANVEKFNPAWPTHLEDGDHPVTELHSKLTGASSPFGDDLVLPIPAEKLNYVHPYTRINK